MKNPCWNRQVKKAHLHNPALRNEDVASVVLDSNQGGNGNSWRIHAENFRFSGDLRWSHIYIYIHVLVHSPSCTFQPKVTWRRCFSGEKTYVGEVVPRRDGRHAPTVQQYQVDLSSGCDLPIKRLDLYEYDTEYICIARSSQLDIHIYIYSICRVNIIIHYLFQSVQIC